MPSLTAALVLALTVSLGNWQLRRADEKAAIQASIDALNRDAPIQVSSATIVPAQLDGRRVAVRGRFIGERTVFIDNRSRNGVAGLQVVSPVRIEGTQQHVLVMRGWVPRDFHDRNRLPRVPVPPGVVEVEGLGQSQIAQVLELTQAPAPGPDDHLWQNIDFDRFARWSGLALQPLLIRQANDLPDDLVRELPAAGADVAKHQGYAFQWYAMAAATLILWIYLGFFRRPDHSDKTS